MAEITRIPGTTIRRLGDKNSTTLKVSLYRMSISIHVHSHDHPSRRRRAVLLMLLRAIRPALEIMNLRIMSFDMGVAHSWTDWIEMHRPVSLRQSVGIATEQMRFGAVLKLRRTALDVTQEELAEYTGISRVHISRIEHGKYFMKERNIAKITAALDAIEWAHNRCRLPNLRKVDEKGEIGVTAS